jgi:hypothetical protein
MDEEAFNCYIVIENQKRQYIVFMVVRYSNSSEILTKEYKPFDPPLLKAEAPLII